MTKRKCAEMNQAESLLSDVANAEPVGFSPFVPGYRDDPYSHYAFWRRTDPVNWGVAPDENGPGCWYLFRYEDARLALSDPRFCVDPTSVIPPEFFPQPPDEHVPLLDMLHRWFIFRDPPVHGVLREHAAHAFCTAALDRLQAQMDALAEDLVADILGNQEVDLIADLALPLPLRMIGRILGVPEADTPQLNIWSVALYHGLDLTGSKDYATRRANGATAALEISDYLYRHLDRVTAKGGQGLMAEMLTALGDTPEFRSEIIATGALLVFLGHETSVNLIGNGLRALIRHPDQFDRLRENPELIRSAVEEFARYDCSAQFTFRFVTEEMVLGGKTLSPGEPVGIVIGAANRDPEVFDRPDQFDVARRPNPHLSFGKGMHACLGAALARREAGAALSALVKACRRIEPLDSAQDWGAGIGLRGLRTLKVQVVV